MMLSKCLFCRNDMPLPTNNKKKRTKHISIEHSVIACAVTCSILAWPIDTIPRDYLLLFTIKLSHLFRLFFLVWCTPKMFCFWCRTGHWTKRPQTCLRQNLWLLWNRWITKGCVYCSSIYISVCYKNMIWWKYLRAFKHNRITL